VIAPSHRRLAEIAGAAYDPAVPAFLERGDVKVTRTVLEGAVVFAHRGTRIRSSGDVTRDLDCVPIDRPGLGHLHAGFITGALAVLEDLDAAIRSETLPVWLASHSLGAAMAIDTAGELTLRGIKLAGAVTFGCPRPGFSTLAAVLRDLPGADYRHGRDPVTEVPFGYWNARPLVPLAAAADEDRRSVSSIWSYVASLEAECEDELRDHFISGYIAALPAAA